MSARPLAVVTGASTGIGYHLARCAAADGHDLIIVARGEEIEARAAELAEYGVAVEAVRADLGTAEGCDTLMARLEARAVALFMANAGSGLGGAFLDQDYMKAKQVIDLNCVGTARLLHDIGRGMRARGSGRILVTGSIVDRIPGPFNAVYNASKAFIDSLAYALRNELKDSGVTVTVLMPGLTDTEFFGDAGMDGSNAAESKMKDDPEDVARDGYRAMLAGKSGVVGGNFGNRVQHALAGVLPDTLLAEMHRFLAGGAKGEKAVADP